MVLDLKYSGKPFAEKLKTLRKEMEKKKSLGFVVSMLDEIAWLYNLRGSEYVVPTCLLSLVTRAWPISCFGKVMVGVTYLFIDYPSLCKAFPIIPCSSRTPS